jgi:hypothetical protein
MPPASGGPRKRRRMFESRHVIERSVEAISGYPTWWPRSVRKYARGVALLHAGHVSDVKLSNRGLMITACVRGTEPSPPSRDRVCLTRTRQPRAGRRLLQLFRRPRLRARCGNASQHSKGRQRRRSRLLQRYRISLRCPRRKTRVQGRPRARAMVYADPRKRSVEQLSSQSPDHEPPYSRDRRSRWHPGHSLDAPVAKSAGHICISRVAS